MNKSVDSIIAEEIYQNYKQARLWGFTMLLAGIILQLLHLFEVPINGIQFMIIISGIILGGAGILFLLGSSSVPKSRADIVNRLQKIMQNTNPNRRLWAAQKLIGYLRDGDFSKDEKFEIVNDTLRLINNPTAGSKYHHYIQVDHIIFLREFSINVKLNKHERKEFSRLVKPLEKIKGLPDEVNNIIMDIIVYDPKKLPIQAYSDYLSIK
jgi:hypothetical protein